MNNTSPGNSHDTFFLWLTSHDGYAQLLLTALLPPEILDILDLSTLKMITAEHTDDRLVRSRCDALFEIHRRDSGKALIYLLLEHKSHHDRLVSLQVLRYLIRRAERTLRHGNQLSCIIPLVLYNGPKPWEHARSLQEIFDVPPKCANFFPDFRVHVVDVPRLPDKIFRGSPEFEAAAMTFKSILQPGFAPKLTGIVQQLTAHLQHSGKQLFSDRSPLQPILTYASSQLDESEFECSLANVFTENIHLKGQTMPSFAEVWYKRGLEQGSEQGIEKGIEKGLEKGLEQGLELGRLIGEIRSLQRFMQHPVSSARRLQKLDQPALRKILRDLRKLLANQ
jgi:predicted transposase YdaD